VVFFGAKIYPTYRRTTNPTSRDNQVGYPILTKTTKTVKRAKRKATLTIKGFIPFPDP
jgi:hypothetical protein